MTYSRRDSAEEQKEACQKATQLMVICEKLHIALDPIDWQNSGMRACVTVTIGEHERKYTGEIVYIIPPCKALTSRKYPAKGYHTILGKTYTNDVSSRYIIDCNDGFPHVVNQSQVII